MLGNPVTWVYATFTLLGVVVVLIILGAFMAYTVKPVALPYLRSRNKPDSPMMILCQRNGRINLVTGKYISEMYEDPNPDNPLAFFKSDTGAYKLGSADVELFFDGAATATSPDLVVAIQELQRMGYKDIDSLMIAIRAGKFRGDSFTLSDGTLSFDDGTISIPLIRQFDPARVEAFSRGKPAIIRSYADTKLNIDRAGRGGKFYDNPQIMALGFIIIAACVGIGLMKALGVF